MLIEFVLDNALLAGLASVLGLITAVMWMQPTDRRAVDSYKAIRLINDMNAMIIDLREKKEFDNGHIPGARHALASEVETRAADAAKKGRPLLLVCERGTVSRSAATKLCTAGNNETHVLRGGLAAWREAGQPLNRAK